MTSENPSLRVFHCPGTTSENTAEALADYQRALRAAPLAVDTRRAYYSRVRGYLAWLTAAAVDGDPLSDPAAAADGPSATTAPTWSTVAKRAPATINTALAAIDDFYTRRGLGPAAADRLDLPANAPRALDANDRVRWLRAIATPPFPRDRVLALLPIYAGLRVSETVALDTDDVHLSARKGTITSAARAANTGRPAYARLSYDHLQTWIDERPDWPGADSPALLLNRRGGGSRSAAPATSSAHHRRRRQPRRASPPTSGATPSPPPSSAAATTWSPSPTWATPAWTPFASTPTPPSPTVNEPSISCHTTVDQPRWRYYTYLVATRPGPTRSPTARPAGSCPPAGSATSRRPRRTVTSPPTGTTGSCAC